MLKGQDIVKGMGIGMVNIGNEDRACSIAQGFDFGNSESGGSFEEDAIVLIVITRMTIGGIPTTGSGCSFEAYELPIFITFSIAVHGGHGVRIRYKLLWLKWSEPFEVLRNFSDLLHSKISLVARVAVQFLASNEAFTDIKASFVSFNIKAKVMEPELGPQSTCV